MLQVGKEHYNFNLYVTKPRWISYWHQISLILSCQPLSVLELGPGPGVIRSVVESCGIKYETVDPDPQLAPDYLGSATKIPIDNSSSDLVCAFQMLEHLPYEDTLIAIKEMFRVAKRFVIISLPDSKPSWYYSIHIPFVGQIKFLIDRPFFKPKDHHFDGEHYWELNKVNYPLSRILNDIRLHGEVLDSFRVDENPYHRFFLIKKY
jgi:predicted SAM-dependent methyltransferase